MLEIARKHGARVCKFKTREIMGRNWKKINCTKRNGGEGNLMAMMLHQSVIFKKPSESQNVRGKGEFVLLR